MKKYTFTIIVSSFAALLLVATVAKKVFTSDYKISAKQQAKELATKDITFSIYDYLHYTKLNNPKVLIIDIRTEEEFAKGHLQNAVNIPVANLFDKVNKEYIDNSYHTTKVLYANSEAEAHRALSMLMMKGYSGFKVLLGGYAMASEYVHKNLNPSYLHYADENKQFNYQRLMPVETGGTSAKDEIKVEASTPRGGC
jgi:rhodanese-related sulfurtransferase